MAFNYNYNTKKSHALYHAVLPLAKLVAKSKYKIKYIGTENLPTDRPIILASNHVTALDPVLIGVGFPSSLHFMAKQELFKNKAVGFFLSRLNSFPVDRSKFDYTAINYAIDLIKSGNSIGIFPEGTRSPDFKPKKAKGGVSYIAKACHCDVVPVSIYTCDRAENGTPLTIRYGKPIKYEELNFDENSTKMKDLRYASSLIMERINELWEKKHGD